MTAPLPTFAAAPPAAPVPEGAGATHASPPPLPVLVVVFGNPHRGDDAFGALVARALRPRPPAGLALLDLSALGPAALLDHLGAARGLLIVDAVAAPGLAPGALLDVDWFDEARPQVVHERVCSSHGLTVASQLDLAARLDLLPPHVRLLGAAIGSVTPEAAVTAPVCRAAALALKRIRHWLAVWSAAAPRFARLRSQPRPGWARIPCDKSERDRVGI